MLRLENVSKHYSGKVILNNVNLIIKSDELTFVVGRSGAGKSTLLNMIGGLDEATTGNIYLDDARISDKLDRYRAESVGFIFQEFNLVSGMSAVDNIELGLAYAGKTGIDIEKGLQNLGITDPGQNVDTMSGGEKQRVAILRSLCKEPSVIIADEPTGNLDSANSEEVMKYIASMKKGRHVIVVTHDMAMAKKYADRIITISDGQVEEDVANDAVTVSHEIGLKVETEDKNDSFRSTVMVGKNSLKIRFKKIMAVSVVVSMAIAMISIAFGIHRLGDKVSKDANINYLESDWITVIKGTTSNYGRETDVFTEEEITRIKKAYDPQQIVLAYNNCIGLQDRIYMLSTENKVEKCEIKVVNIDGFFEERVMSNDIKGSFVKSDDEIIIAKDAAEIIFGTIDCIGNKVKLNDGMGHSIEMTVCGVNMTINPVEKIYTYVSSGATKRLYEAGKEELAEVDLFVYNDAYENVRVSSFMVPKGVNGVIKLMDSDNPVNIIYGRKPESENDILVSKKTAESISKMAKISETDYVKLVDVQLFTMDNGLQKVKVCGVYEGDSDEVYIERLLYDRIYTLLPNTLELYMKNGTDMNKLNNSILKDVKLETRMSLEQLKDHAMKQTAFYRITTLLLGFLMVLMSFVMIHSFTKISVLERRREIAVLKSLGAKNSSVMSVLTIDILAIMLISTGLSMVITFAVINIVPKFVEELRYLYFPYPTIVWISLCGIFAVFMYIHTLIGTRKLVRTMPAQLLKQS